jgi:hypothetical protein
MEASFRRRWRAQLPCRDYENRPDLCRAYDCGRPCEQCGGCEGNIVLRIPGKFPDASFIDFLERHGIGVGVGPDGAWELIIFAPCRDYVPVS